MWVCVHVSISAPSLHARGATTSLLFFIAQMQITNMWNVNKCNNLFLFEFKQVESCFYVWYYKNIDSSGSDSNTQSTTTRLWETIQGF